MFFTNCKNLHSQFHSTVRKNEIFTFMYAQTIFFVKQFTLKIYELISRKILQKTLIGNFRIFHTLKEIFLFFNFRFYCLNLQFLSDKEKNAFSSEKYCIFIFRLMFRFDNQKRKKIFMIRKEELLYDFTTNEMTSEVFR